MIKPWQSDLDHLKWVELAGVKTFRKTRVLDLGCGSGFLCETAINEGARSAVGVDIVEPAITNKTKWKFHKRNLDNVCWENGIDEKFDYIFAFDILEHVESPYRFLQSCHHLLVDSGTLILTTPNLSSWEKFAKPRSWSGVRDEQHKILFNQYSLKFTLSRAGFKTAVLNAPIRKLTFLGPLQPNFGGQIFCQASK